MSEHTLTVDGAVLSYDDRGSGPVVIVAHGLTMSRAADRKQGLAAFEELIKDGFRVISYDARGHGESTGRSEPADYLWSRLADDLLALADVVSPTAPVHAVGTSMGTGTILHALIRRPQRFRSVALTAPPTAWGTRPAQQEMYKGLAVAAETLPRDEFAALNSAAPAPPIFAEIWEPREPSIDMALFPSVMRGAGRSDLPAEEEVTGITVPVLLLAWATDPAHPVSTTEKLHTLLTVSEAVVAEDVASIRMWPSRVANFFTKHS
ncbi:alpha/beta fold hydrolase [Paenarthrobacter sp. NPDC090520]|uniref:alpha/beta fold hydrolase n=1 Tax=Paenarthrobacter sp. NPDC090520 TaxID=3364382 RepID=UPI00382671E1